MLHRQDVIEELVNQGLKYGAADSRVVKATQNLKKEGAFEPHKDNKNHNVVSYTNEEANRLRVKLGLIKATPTDGESERPTPDTKAESEQTETETEGKPKQEVKSSPLSETETREQSKTIVEPEPASPSRSVDQLAKVAGPQKQQEEKPDKPETKPKPAEKARRPPSWVWFAGGAVALVVVAWLIVRRKGGEEKSESKETPSSRSGVDLADQYRIH